MTPRLPVLRRSDFSLEDHQKELRDTVAQFVDKECPSALVRDADPLAFDRDLWSKVLGLRVATMALPTPAGGDGAGLVELALVVEELGRCIAPVPLVDHAVALRVLAATRGAGALDRRLGAEAPTTLALRPHLDGEQQLLPAGAVADAAVVLRGRELLLVEYDAPAPLAKTLGGAPLGSRDVGAGDVTVLANGFEAVEAFETALREWKTLTSALLVGVARGALDVTVQYANERIAFGVPIGTFQALSHPLADVRIAIEGTRRLAWRAAWYGDHEPSSAGLHASIAFLRACETANFAASQGIHTQGGFGFTLESDLHLYFRRAKSWSLVAGDPRAELARIADSSFGAGGKCD
jgi:alkylation response protein AidB-like acyl-CoA dehydrogenase